MRGMSQNIDGSKNKSFPISIHNIPRRYNQIFKSNCHESMNHHHHIKFLDTWGCLLYPPPSKKKILKQHVVYCSLNFFHEKKNCMNVAFKRHRCKANCTTIAKSNKWNTISVKQSSYLRCLSRKSTPMVFLYESVKFPLQNLWIIDDLPTPPSPTTTTFVWVVYVSRLCLI